MQREQPRQLTLSVRGPTDNPFRAGIGFDVRISISIFSHTKFKYSLLFWNITNNVYKCHRVITFITIKRLFIRAIIKTQKAYHCRHQGSRGFNHKSLMHKSHFFAETMLKLKLMGIRDLWISWLMFLFCLLIMCKNNHSNPGNKQSQEYLIPANEMFIQCWFNVGPAL